MVSLVPQLLSTFVGTTHSAMIRKANYELFTFVSFLYRTCVSQEKL